MQLNTRLLFLELLAVFEPDTVCDVGSMNGADALAFRRALPRARVFAFEPNPGNLARMRADERLTSARIEVLPSAATDFDGEASFFLVKADYEAPHDRRGMSSLYRRAETELLEASVTVPTARLDTKLRGVGARRLALWIDVEGKAYEALEGARGLFTQICLVHVEVETCPCIGERQKFYADVRRLLEDAGLRQLATDRNISEEQFNAVFVRRELSARQAALMTLCTWRLTMRRMATDLLRRLCPGCFRRILRYRQRATAKTSWQAREY